MRPEWFDFKKPDYDRVFMERTERLDRIRAREKIKPGTIATFKEHYKLKPADFIDDWGCTSDPRNIERGLPALIPFILFDRQREMIQEILDAWRGQYPLLIEKSRDCGASWVAIALSCTLGLQYDGLSIGFGSRKEEYVDKISQPKALFPKARAFLQHIPTEFRGGWHTRRHSAHMRVNFPETDASMTGEAGDQIGRGDRKSIYMVDESAYLERPELVEQSLSATTNCRVDISSVNGMNNPFARKRHEGKIRVFIFDWRQDPRKDEAWYEKQKGELDPVTVAQEIDRDYSASVEGIVIPGPWVRAAFDANKKLGLSLSGPRFLSLDIADEGRDKNAACGAYGTEIELIEEWSGKGSDIFASVQRAFGLCDEHGYSSVQYDSDGLGAGARGDARIINATRKARRQRQIDFDPFRGSEKVFRPEAQDVKGRFNKDFFQNRKAQGWWGLRTRFQKTYRWVVEGKACDPDEIISISKDCGNYLKLASELSQATYATNNNGKIVIDKSPDGMKSPNLADAVMIRYATTAKPMKISTNVLARAAIVGRSMTRAGMAQQMPTGLAGVGLRAIVDAARARGRR